MANWREEVERAREEARRARDEAKRLRHEAREMAHRLRDESRQQAHAERDAMREAARSAARSFVAGQRSRGSWDERDMGEGVKAEQAFAVDGIRELNFEQTAGRVSIRPCAGDETPGITTTSTSSAPQLQVLRDGDRLLISVRMAKGWLFRRRQGASTVVRLGAAPIAIIKTNVGYGDIQFRGLPFGSLKVEVGAGTISCDATTGHIDANVGAGRIVLSGHHGHARCNTGTGDIVMDIAEVTDGDYVANTGVGRAELRLPPGHQVEIKASSGIGRARIEYPNAGSGSPVRARIDTGVGEAVVRAREPGQAPVPPPPQATTPRGPAARRRETEELRVLQMLEEGRITAKEAADLIAALQGAAMPPGDDALNSSGEPSPGDIPPPMA